MVLDKEELFIKIEETFNSLDNITSEVLQVVWSPLSDALALENLSDLELQAICYILEINYNDYEEEEEEEE
jgi:hypothetical protein